MTDKTTLLTAKVPALPVNHIHPMIARACQILETYEPATAANWPAGVDTTTEALDALAAQETVATGSLTATQLIAATTAHTLIAAPGAGKINIVKSIEIFLDYGAAFTSGDDVSIMYDGVATIGTVDKTSLLGTADLNFLVSVTGYSLSSDSVAGFSLTGNANKAIKLKVASTAFADGVGSIVKYKIKYETVTLLT